MDAQEIRLIKEIEKSINRQNKILSEILTLLRSLAGKEQCIESGETEKEAVRNAPPFQFESHS